MIYTEILKDIEAVRGAALNSESLGAALDKLGIHRGGKTYKAFRVVCDANNIPCTFDKRYQVRETPLAEILIENSPYVNNKINIKKRVLREGYLINICVLCGQGPEWNGLPLVLQLDHINGKNNDHRLENLRILCPNCHTQTETYAGKKRIKNEM